MLRIKNRPVKKKTGVVAGVAQSGSGRERSVGNGAVDDNEKVSQHVISQIL